MPSQGSNSSLSRLRPTITAYFAVFGVYSHVDRLRRASFEHRRDGLKDTPGASIYAQTISLILPKHPDKEYK